MSKQNKQRVIWLFTMPGSLSSTKRKPARHTDGRIPVFTFEKVAYQYMIARWRLKAFERGKTWCNQWTGGERIKMSFNTPFHEWREIRLTKRHVIDPEWQEER